MSILKQCQSNDLYQYTLSSGNGTFRYFASSPPGRFEPLDVSLPAAFGRTASPAQLLWPTGFLCGWSVGLEFLAGQLA